jgi:ATP-dependent exoDNAse (exonuclease V) beta subunit
MPFSALFGYTINKLKLPGNADADELECLYFALELIRSEEAKGNITNVCEGADYLTKLITSSDRERSLSFKRELQKVHIANLHKVKGLEATVVILADSSKTLLPPEIRTEYGSDGGKSYVFTCKDKSFLPIFGTKKFAVQSEREKLSAQAEYTRLLYVAATRAKSALIVSGAGYWNDIAKAADGDIFEKYPESPAKTETGIETVSAEKLYENAECVLEGSKSDAPSYKISLPSKVKLKSTVSENDTISEETEAAETESAEERKKRRNAALIGTLIHRLMECVVSSGNAYAPAALADEILESYGASAGYRNMLTGVYEKLTSGGYGQTNGMPADILAELKAAEEKYCEVPFCYDKGDDTIENGVIDLIYKKDGKWRIVDYKTTQEMNQLDDKYEGQLAAYKTAFEKMTGNTAEVFIYHIEAGDLS